MSRYTRTRPAVLVGAPEVVVPSDEGLAVLLPDLPGLCGEAPAATPQAVALVRLTGILPPKCGASAGFVGTIAGDVGRRWVVWHRGGDMKFAMGADVLSGLTKQTSSAGEDLGVLVRQLAEAAQPLEGNFNGAGRAAFDRFKSETDRIATELNGALGAVLQGISGMDRSFGEGDVAMADQTRAAEGSSSFDAARFGSARG